MLSVIFRTKVFFLSRYVFFTHYSIYSFFSDHYSICLMLFSDLFHPMWIPFFVHDLRYSVILYVFCSIFPIRFLSGSYFVCSDSTFFFTFHFLICYVFRVNVSILSLWNFKISLVKYLPKISVDLSVSVSTNFRFCFCSDCCCNVSNLELCLSQSYITFNSASDLASLCYYFGFVPFYYVYSVFILVLFLFCFVMF